MATKPVRFEFQCEKKNLTYIYPLPSALATSDVNAKDDPDWLELFVKSIRPIVMGHQKDAREASSDKCGICGAPTVSCAMTPMSYLHKSPPFITVYVNPICKKGSCDMRTRQVISDTMNAVSQATQDMDPDSTPAKSGEAITCQVCGTTKNVLKCGKCKVIGYCGPEHQKMDWKLHKKNCKNSSNLDLVD